jgi:hypothetical protein
MSGVVVKKAPNPTGIIILFLLLLVPIVLLVVAHYEPLQPGWFHKGVLSVLHGGVRGDNKEVVVDGCVPFTRQQRVQTAEGLLVQDVQEYLAVRRIKRTITFGDRSQLIITYNSEPYSNPQCP